MAEKEQENTPKAEPEKAAEKKSKSEGAEEAKKESESAAEKKESPKENPEASERETPRQQRKVWVWIMLMVNIVFILILMTLGIIALRVGNYLPETDIVFIVGKKNDVDVGDAPGDATDGIKNSWNGSDSLNIFSKSHINSQGQITVESADETKVIAPGTYYEYKFSMYNNGNVAVFYEVDVDFALRLAGVKVDSITEKAFPLRVRLLSQTEEFIIGEKNEYVTLEEAAVQAHRRILGANSYETFTLQLVWDFEEDDLDDTTLGNLALEKDISVTIELNTYAEEHIDPATLGGTSIDAEKENEIGGTVRWLWVLLLMINTAVIIFYVSWLMNKRLQKW